MFGRRDTRAMHSRKTKQGPTKETKKERVAAGSSILIALRNWWDMHSSSTTEPSNVIVMMELSLFASFAERSACNNCSPYANSSPGHCLPFLSRLFPSSTFLSWSWWWWRCYVTYAHCCVASGYNIHTPIGLYTCASLIPLFRCYLEAWLLRILLCIQYRPTIEHIHHRC